MGQTAIYKFQPRSAFHFGERGVGVEETANLLHSDTLFSAIVSAWRVLGDEQPDPDDDNNLPSVKPFSDGNPPFRISSAFPYAGDVLFFPRPLVPLGTAKVLKKVEFVSEEALYLLSQGSLPDTLDKQRQELLQGGRVWAAPTEVDQIKSLLLRHMPDEKERERWQARFNQDTRQMKLWSGSGGPPAPHVAIDRVNAQTNLFFAGRLEFAPECGLYFWVDVAGDSKALPPNGNPATPGGGESSTASEETDQQRLEAALTFLQYEGLGGRRTTGHGQFTFHHQLRSLPDMGATDYRMTLALYHPAEAEVQAGVLREAWYRRIHRRGWIFSPDGKYLRRKGLWMLREGSVLRRAVSGTMPDLRPAVGFVHPIWRYGYAFAMPVRLDELL